MAIPVPAGVKEAANLQLVALVGLKARVIVMLLEAVHLPQAAISVVNFGGEETSPVTYRRFKQILTHL